MERIPIQLSDASGVPYYRQIMDQLSQFIHSGQLSPKTRLPSVRDLAAQLLVSLITVRRSYADLEAAGLIVRRQGQGTFVADRIETASRDRSLTDARSALADALDKARRLGLTDSEIRRFVSDRLKEKEHHDD